MGGTPFVDRADLRTIGLERAERKESCCYAGEQANLCVEEKEYHHLTSAWKILME